MIASRVVLFAAALSLSAYAEPGEASPVEQDACVVVPAPKLDNGLGELAGFETWAEPWVCATPAEKLDSGLGDLAPYSEWRYTWVYSMPAEKIESGLGAIRLITTSESSALHQRTTR